MSADADLFVVTPKENLVDVGNVVTKALNIYVRAKLDDYNDCDDEGFVKLFQENTDGQ